MIEIRVQEWSKESAEEIIFERGFLIDVENDKVKHMEVMELIREALKTKDWDFFGVN